MISGNVFSFRILAQNQIRNPWNPRVDTLYDAKKLLSGHSKVGTKIIGHSMSRFLHFCL